MIPNEKLLADLIVITPNLLQHAKRICTCQSHNREKAAEPCRYGQPAAQK
jgi:hypothetical protein